MKILYVLKSLPDRFAGGIQTHTWQLSSQMLKLGHEVHILSAGSILKREFRQDMDGRTVIQIPYFPGRHLPLLPTLAEEWAFNYAAFQWLLTNSRWYDLVHLQGRSGFFFPKKRNELPVVATIHGLITIENQLANMINTWSFDLRAHQKWARGWEANAIYNSDQLIIVSHQIADQLRASGYKMSRLVSKITQIYNGITPFTLDESIKTDPNLLVFVGRLNRIKGIFPLVKAMRKVRPSVRLVMVGDGPDREALERAIKMAGVEERVKLTGAVSSAEVGRWIQRAAFCVGPSLHESQGIALLEALTCGKAVVTSDLPGIRESVKQGETGLMVPPNDPAGIAHAIEYLLDHPWEATRMGLEGQKMVNERFSWQKIAAQTEQIYEMAIEKKYVLSLSQHALAEVAVP